MIGLLLAAWLLFEEPRVYHPVAIAALGRSVFTHVEVIGRVTLVRDEADGDVHIRLVDPHGHFVVAEIIPSLPPAVLAHGTFSEGVTAGRPHVGQTIRVRGIRRWDTQHRWPEVHPIEAIEIVK